MSGHGIRTMAEHEFRLRLRAGRWRWLLGAWFAVLLGFTALLRWALTASTEDETIGTAMFGGLMLFVLGLAMLVVPALTAQSVNGDRERGVLATLQVTLLTPADIALGKLAAAWATALVFLLASIPMAVWAITGGGVRADRVVVTYLVVAVLLGVICALAQCLSAVLARSTTSAVLSYLTVFALSAGTVIAFALGTAATTERVTHRTGDSTYTSYETHTAHVWWLLAPNPFVILADAAPRTPAFDRTLDPLGEIGDAVREARSEQAIEQRFAEFCGPDGWCAVERPPAQPVWPWGLAFDLLLGVGAVAVTIRRLTTPLGSVPRAVRIA